MAFVVCGDVLIVVFLKIIREYKRRNFSTDATTGYLLSVNQEPVLNFMVVSLLAMEFM